MEKRDEENISEAINNSEMTFDNLVVLKEFSNIVNHVRRPQLGNVKSQLKAHDAANLQKQKKPVLPCANID
ncbi:hypothetical protein MSG28_004686 [Choristoneura fumiferana]|uniref:Uncharacterized protein n=1 Tax=Choristoneura fumiferana TaxID=7141 RepID=A0ACC0K889_CHOFU|nr:hypothetical protein MSG28_004686 [Choristoneura fumiferana]